MKIRATRAFALGGIFPPGSFPPDRAASSARSRRPSASAGRSPERSKAATHPPPAVKAGRAVDFGGTASSTYAKLPSRLGQRRRRATIRPSAAQGHVHAQAKLARFRLGVGNVVQHRRTQKRLVDQAFRGIVDDLRVNERQARRRQCRQPSSAEVRAGSPASPRQRQTTTSAPSVSRHRADAQSLPQLGQRRLRPRRQARRRQTPAPPLPNNARKEWPGFGAWQSSSETTSGIYFIPRPNLFSTIASRQPIEKDRFARRPPNAC